MQAQVDQSIRQQELSPVLGNSGGFAFVKSLAFSRTFGVDEKMPFEEQRPRPPVAAAADGTAAGRQGCTEVL